MGGISERSSNVKNSPELWSTNRTFFLILTQIPEVARMAAHEMNSRQLKRCSSDRTFTVLKNSSLKCRRKATQKQRFGRVPSNGAKSLIGSPLDRVYEQCYGAHERPNSSMCPSYTNFQGKFGSKTFLCQASHKESQIKKPYMDEQGEVVNGA